jgi:hypothetical protein
VSSSIELGDAMRRVEIVFDCLASTTCYFFFVAQSHPDLHKKLKSQFPSSDVMSDYFVAKHMRSVQVLRDSDCAVVM